MPQNFYFTTINTVVT